jgi:Holliday junction resolvase RusA-like endonuclease
MIKFTYYGEAVGKGRPRITRRGSFVHTYTPEKTRVFEENILLAFMASTEEQMPVYPKGTALRVKVTIGCSIPKSYSKKKQAQCREGIIVPDKKPDIDNILKSIFDALQGGYAFDDDSQIVEIYAEKKYAEKPFVEVEIDEFK